VEPPARTLGRPLGAILWEPMTEPGTEGSPTTTIESQWQKKVEKKKVK
jgi:hypothetical protein